jgi:hypothetical protein
VSTGADAAGRLTETVVDRAVAVVVDAIADLGRGQHVADTGGLGVGTEHMTGIARAGTPRLAGAADRHVVVGDAVAVVVEAIADLLVAEPAGHAAGREPVGPADEGAGLGMHWPTPR